MLEITNYCVIYLIIIAASM